MNARITMSKMKWLLLVLTISAATITSAVERKAYKYVDEQGNVTYSQTPPVTAKSEPKKVDISPAHQGRGGDASDRITYPRDRYTAPRDQVRSLGPASNDKQAQLIAECERNRGSNCRDPATLRYMEDQNRPRSSPR
jgi:hypothetical protein